MTLSTNGTPLSIQIGKKTSMKTISSQTFYNKKRKHDVSDCTINSIAMECQRNLGRLRVGASTSKKIKIWSHALNDYYTVEKNLQTLKEKTKLNNKKFYRS